MKTTIRKIIAISGFLLLSPQPHLLQAQTKGHEVEIEVCDFRVPKEISRANASFTVIYAVQTGDDGRSIRVEKKKNDFLVDEPFVACIKNWVLPNNNKHLIVIFAWKHGEGWTEVAISGDGVNYRIRIKTGALSQCGGS